MPSMDSKKFKWDIFYKGDFIGTAFTEDRITVIRKVLGDKADTYIAGEVTFKLVSLGLKSDE